MFRSRVIMRYRPGKYITDLVNLFQQDGMTYGVAQVTYNVYKAMIGSLTGQRKLQITSRSGMFSMVQNENLIL